MTKEELLKKIDFEKSWLYDCGIFGSDVDIAFHAIKNKVIEALEQDVLDKIFPDNATNGDMIKTIFPNLEWRDERGDTKSYILEPEHILSPKLIAFNSWWDAPYKALEQEPFINKPCVSSGVCEHDKNKVLDKIRAEIMSKDGLEEALSIIDKYKAESEVKE